MPIKTKIGIALVAVIAIVSVYELGKYVHVLAGDGPTLANISSVDDTPNCATCDPDHDGLTNAEEVLWGTDPFNADTDGDGFKDGEEVASGHNPLIPGPNDLINSDNLTDQLSNLTVAGLAAGALNPASDSYQQNLADITSSVADSGTYLFNKKISADSLTVITANTDTNLAYIKSSAPLLKKFSDALGDQLNHISGNLNSIGDKGFSAQAQSYFSQQADLYDSVAKDATLISVPKPFSDADATFISLAQQMQAIDTAVSNGDADVVKAALALDALGGMSEKYVSFLNDYFSAANQQHVDMSSLNDILK